MVYKDSAHWILANWMISNAFAIMDKKKNIKDVPIKFIKGWIKIIGKEDILLQLAYTILSPVFAWLQNRTKGCFQDTVILIDYKDDDLVVKHISYKDAAHYCSTYGNQENSNDDARLGNVSEDTQPIIE